MKLFISLLAVLYLGCASPQERTESIPFTKLCPNFGFIKESEIPIDSLHSEHSGQKMVLIAYDLKNGSRTTSLFPLNKLTSASEISTLEDFAVFNARYSEICGAESPHKEKIKYIISKREKDKSSLIFNSVAESKRLDIRDDTVEFANAWYNKFVSPSDNHFYKGSEFEYESKKFQWQKIRDYKYLITKVGEDGKKIKLIDYNFSKECFDFEYMNSGVPLPTITKYMKDPQAMNGFDSIELEAYNRYEKIYCIPVLKTIAEQFKKDNENKLYQWELLIEIKKVVDKSMDLRCKDYTYEYTKIACKKDSWESVKLRRFVLSIIAFRATHSETGESIEGKMR